MPEIRARLVAIAALASGFVALSIMVANGWLHDTDDAVAHAMAGAWSEPLHPLFQVIAEFGGLEFTSVVMVGLAYYLLRHGFGADVWAIAAFAIAVGLEVVYKATLYHPAPAAGLHHADGPSMTDLFETATGINNSFPSGHVVRVVISIGLMAFVVRRLAVRPRVAAAALPVAAVVIGLVSLDRIYLDVHWISDVLGGLLLGLVGLLSATVWLDRPGRIERPPP